MRENLAARKYLRLQYSILMDYLVIRATGEYAAHVKAYGGC